LAKASEIPELITMANTIRRHIDGILAYWPTGGVTSASMKGFNNKIGWLTRQAYGYRDEEYLILKIYDLLNLKVAKEL
jgi:transposase